MPFLSGCDAVPASAAVGEAGVNEAFGFGAFLLVLPAVAPGCGFAPCGGARLEVRAPPPGGGGLGA